MYAFEIPGLRFSLPAASAITEHRFVTVDATGKAAMANATTPVIGVAMNRVVDGTVKPTQQIAEISDGIVIVEAGDVVAAGSKVAADANGKAIVAAPETNACGVALLGAAKAGELITVKM